MKKNNHFFIKEKSFVVLKLNKSNIFFNKRCLSETINFFNFNGKL